MRYWRFVSGLVIILVGTRRRRARSRGRGADRVWRVVENNPAVERLVRNRWIWLACLDAGSGALWELRATGFVPHTPEHALAVVTGDSAAWYQGKRGFLPPVTIVHGPSVASDRRVTQARPSH